MDQRGRERNIMMLWVIVVLGIAYSSLLYSQRTLTGMNHVDGIIGVMLGLYICSHPAANLVDMLFFRQGARRRFSSRRSAVLFLLLNMVVLFVSGIVIFVGTTHLIGRTDED
jgi:hypothetical protein